MVTAAARPSARTGARAGRNEGRLAGVRQSAISRLRLDLRRLQWITLIGPPLFFIALAVASYVPHRYGLLSHEGEHVLIAGIMIGTALAFSPIAFHVIRAAQRQLTAQNVELAALHQVAIGRSQALDALHRAALAVTSELSLQTVLQRVVGLSCELVRASYGALAVRGTGTEVKQFVSSGLTAHEAMRSGLPADGRSLLAPESDSSGGHDVPPAALEHLRIPIVFQSRDIGVLYLARMSSGFSRQEVDLLSMFALQAAIAIENARLYEEVQRVAVLDERERIAREMHDGLGQLLGFLSTKAQAVNELLAAGRYDSAGKQVRELADAAQDLHGDMREAISGLRTTTELKRGLVPVLREVVQRFRDRSRLPVRVEVPGSALAVSWGPIVDAELIRIVQEALANVRKHAGAQRAWVRISREDGRVAIRVEDDGCGFDPASSPRGTFGLRCMAERADKIGATLSIVSGPGRGTQVEVALQPPAGGAEGGNAHPGR